MGQNYFGHLTWPYKEESRFFGRVLVRVRVEGFDLPGGSEPSRERVKVSHVIVECIVINHHPSLSRDKISLQWCTNIITIHLTPVLGVVHILHNQQGEGFQMLTVDWGGGGGGGVGR